MPHSSILPGWRAQKIGKIGRLFFQVKEHDFDLLENLKILLWKNRKNIVVVRHRF